MENVKDYTVGASLGFKFQLEKYESVDIHVWETLPLEDSEDKKERKQKTELILKELENRIAEEMKNMLSKAGEFKKNM